MKKKRALISVYDKTGIVGFVQGLRDLGWEIVSTGGTARVLKDAGITVIPIEEVSGNPEAFGGRMKTISFNVESAILFDRENHFEEAEKLGIQPIDMVVCNLYPFVKTVESGASHQEIIENIDIGGPTMLRAAAKNYKYVWAICDPNDYDSVFMMLVHYKNDAVDLKERLAAKVFQHMLTYEGAISRYLAIHTGKARKLAKGENTYQSPTYLIPDGSDDPLGLDKFTVENGNPGYINMADLDRILEMLCLLHEALYIYSKGNKKFCIVVVCKHGNPCGIGVDLLPEEAINKALYGDPVAVMGGELICNFSIDEKLAKVLAKPSQGEIGRPRWILDMIIAPCFTDLARDILKGSLKRPRRLLSNSSLLNPTINPQKTFKRQVRSGILIQQAANFVLDLFDSKKVDKVIPNLAGNIIDYFIAWIAAWKSNSNTVALAKDGMLIGLGCSQPSRVEAVRLAINRAKAVGHNPKGSIFASD
ncbi:hypothetical protein K8R66_04530, partial [bacterium]|nr:hypothetical protein [bacterium]